MVHVDSDVMAATCSTGITLSSSRQLGLSSAVTPVTPTAVVCGLRPVISARAIGSLLQIFGAGEVMTWRKERQRVLWPKWPWPAVAVLPYFFFLPIARSSVLSE